MTLDGFLTVLALLAAIYAVLPAEQQLRLGLAWKAQAAVGVIAAAAILGLELYEVRPPLCPEQLGAACRWLTLPEGDTGSPRKVAFLVALAWLILAVVIHSRSRPSLGSLPASTRLAVELLDEEKYGDALALLEPSMERLAKASRRESRRQRFHDWLATFGPVDRDSFLSFRFHPGERRFSGENWPKWAAWPVRQLARFVPSYDRAEAAASDMLQMIFGSSRLLTYIAERRPYAGLPLIRNQVYGASDFSERYLARLIATPGSALYHELTTNLVSDGPVTYALPPRNRILHFLFADAEQAVQLSAWKGVGDYVKRLLDGDERPEYWAWLNGDQGWFDEDRFHDPTFMGMIYFDIMVRAAAHQDVMGHMWLYYLDRFAERLEAGYDSSGEGIDREAEFPIRAARMLYELTQIVTGWVELFQNLPEESIHREFPDRPESPGAIPHAAAIALGRILAIVANSNKIDRDVAVTINTVIMRTIRSFHPDGAELSQMRAWLIDALLADRNRDNQAKYWENLADLFLDTDYILRDEVADYAEALQNRLDGGAQ